MWTIVEDEKALENALKYARGSYQRGILLGSENLSGSSLKGKAKRWSGKYAKSRANLLDRLHAAGIPVTERLGDHNKRILVIGGYPITII